MTLQNIFNNNAPFLVSGPCALTTEKITRQIAFELVRIRKELKIDIIFKGSYYKGNRTKHNAFHGVGIEKGLDLLDMVKNDYALPVITDAHESNEITLVAEVVDIIQIPAFLCKQTKLLFAAGDSGKPVNIKKGQMMTIGDTIHAIDKIYSRGNDNVLITERGTIFGYTDTINDFRGLYLMKETECPVIFDGTHSVRMPSKRSDASNGAYPEFIRPLSHCAATLGAQGLFLETYVEGEDNPCDSSASLGLDMVKQIAGEFISIRKAVGKILNEKN